MQFEVHIIGNKDKNKMMCSEVCARARHRQLWLKRTYGLSEQQYEDIRTRQGNTCAICKTDKAGGACKATGHKRGSYSDWHIDHDHSTGKVRGLLCHGCNVAVGFLKNNPAIIPTLERYLLA